MCEQAIHRCGQGLALLSYLPGEQNVLPSLGHRSVSGGHHQDAAVHLSGSSDHVLDVIRVPGAVDVAVVAQLGLVLDVGAVDGDAAGLLLRRFVNVAKCLDLTEALGGKDSGDGLRESRLAVVDVADGADVDMWLGPIEGGSGADELRASQPGDSTGDGRLRQ